MNYQCVAVFFSYAMYDYILETSLELDRRQAIIVSFAAV